MYRHLAYDIVCKHLVYDIVCKHLAYDIVRDADFLFFPLFLARSVLSIFSYFIFLFLNFLSLFVFIFCETAGTRRFSVIFAKVQWHPCTVCKHLAYDIVCKHLAYDIVCKHLA